MFVGNSHAIGVIRKMACVAVVSVLSITCFSAEKKTLLELPVSVPVNPAYLTSVTERPWWNGAWAKRIPILVSGQADEQDDFVVVDTVIDFGEPVDAKEVRVVTPWETLVPCVATSVGKDAADSAVRLLFKTKLRPHENKPFLVYYGNPAAKGENIPSDVTLDQNEATFRIRNGVIDVVFDRNHVTDGLIRSLRLLGSQSLLFDCANGYAKAGFVFTPNANNGWDSGTVIADNELVKSVRFTCADATVTFSVYAEQPRVDWTYRLGNESANSVQIRMNWAPGGGTSDDDFFYCGKSGKVLTQRAALDFVTDCMAVPKGSFGDWLSEGWYAFGERRFPCIGGLVFDHKAVAGLQYGSEYGLNMNLILSHKTEKGRPATGSGAIVATMGSVNDIRRIYRRIAKPVVVSVGAAQAKVEKPYRIPRLDRDWCVDYDVGWQFGGDGGSAEPLMKDPQWANRVAERMRSYGSTAVCVLGYPWWTMPIQDKSLYDRTMAAMNSGGFEDWILKRKWPTWEEMQGRGKELQAFMDAIRANGMAIHTWSTAVPGWPCSGDGYFMKPINDLNVEYADIRIKMGQGCAYNWMLYGEGVLLPKSLVKKNGSTSYWTWDNPQEAFDAFDRQHELVRDFYRQMKERHPDVPVFLWNEEQGGYLYEKFSSEDEGFYDSIEVEMLPSHGFGHTKHVAKRMRSHFNNREGHTVWHHYFLLNPTTADRIREIEWPFIFGVNGYSQENLTYEITNLEMSEVTADFFRFAEYTRLGEKVAKMAPIKNLGVYRDPKAFRADVLKHRLKTPYPYGSQQDGRVRSFSELKNFNYDVIGPKYFTAGDLAKYRVVYVPEDDVLSEAEAKELLSYVRNGGSAIVEGETVKRLNDEEVKGLKTGVATPMGKGKMLWFKDVMTDRLAKRDAKAMQEVRRAIADLGGVEPHVITGSTALDGNLQSSPEGLFLGLYNSANTMQTGTVSLASFKSGNMYVLDVKSGTRVPLVDGKFAVSVDAENTGYYLIGDDDFTAVPSVKTAAWEGPSVGCDRANERKVKIEDVTGFKPMTVVEFVRTNDEGVPVSLSRTVAAKYDVRSMTAEEFDVKACKKALATAVMFHLVDAEANKSDVVFETCADELKALLKRGGSIVFTRSPTGPAARKFLKEVEVFDPNPSAESNIGDTWGKWCGPEGHPLLTSCHVASPVEPSTTHTPEWWLWRSICDYFQYRRAFGAWDEKRQQRLFCPKKNGEKYAVLLVQENVLGSGRVVFNEGRNIFTDWYEPIRLAENVLSWLTGMKTDDHAKKVTALNGGPGMVVK